MNRFDPNSRAILFRRVRAAVFYLFAILLAVFFLAPYFVMFSKSFMESYESQMIPPKLFPALPTFEGYINAVDPLFFKYLGNTVYVLLFNMIAGTVSAMLCAYGFAKVKWKGRGVVFALVLSTMMMPGIVLQIPLYIVYVKVLHWTDTLNPLTIPALFGGGAMNIFLIRQFMRGLPSDIDDASRIDGAGSIVHFFCIIIPLCRPIMFYLMLMSFMGAWNDFMGPLVYISDEDLFTIPVGIYLKFTEADYYGTSFPNTQMATGTILSLPLIVLFIIFQEQLIDGITIGSVKG